MKFRAQHTLPEQGVPPFTVEENLGEKVLAIPFKVEGAGAIVGITVDRSPSSTVAGPGDLGVALVKGARTLYEGQMNDDQASTFYIPLQAKTTYQILLWGLGDFIGEAMLDVVPITVKPVSVLPEQTEFLLPSYAEPIALELTEADQKSYLANEVSGAPLHFSSTPGKIF